MFNPQTLQTLTVKYIIENDIPFQVLPNLIHRDINTLLQIRQFREEEEELSQKIEILCDKKDECEFNAIGFEVIAYNSKVTSEKQQLIEKSEFFFHLVYKISALVEGYEKKMGNLEEEEGFLIATLPHQYRNMDIKLKELSNYDETKHKLMEILDL